MDIDTEYRALCITAKRESIDTRIAQGVILASSALVYSTFLFVGAAMLGWM